MSLLGVENDWMTTELGNLVVEKGGVQTGPFGSQLHQKDYVSEGTPIITVEHLGDNKIIHSNPPRVTDSDRDRLEKYSLQSGDIVFSRVGSVDRRALVRSDEDGWLFSGRCLRVRTDQQKIDSAYLSYYLGHERVKSYIRAVAVGATMPSINTKILSELPVSFPISLVEQKAIAHILGTLDDKIELNQKMNQTLEEIAKAIFKSWFVDFDPVRAKAEGRPTGLPPEISDLFPNELVDSEIGEIPKGWGLRRLDSLLELAYGKSLPAKSRVEGEVPVYGSGGINGYHNESLCDETSIVVGRAGTVGSLYWVDKPFFPIDSVFFVQTKESIHFCYYLMQTLRLHTMNTGAAVPGLNRNNAYRLEFPNAPEPLVQKFAEIAKSLRNRISLSEKGNKILSELRDTLLPKLISGELRILDAEKFLEEACV